MDSCRVAVCAVSRRLARSERAARLRIESSTAFSSKEPPDPRTEPPEGGAPSFEFALREVALRRRTVEDFTETGLRDAGRNTPTRRQTHRSLEHASQICNRRGHERGARVLECILPILTNRLGSVSQPVIRLDQTRAQRRLGPSGQNPPHRTTPTRIYSVLRNCRNLAVPTHLAAPAMVPPTSVDDAKL